MELTRRDFLKGTAAGGAMFALPRLVRAQGSGSSYSVAVLGDTHFDQALAPEFVASFDLTQNVSSSDMARYTEQSTYHRNWSANNQTHFAEFIRNGDMWRERCPRLVAASAALATSTPTRFLLQLGDLVQGDCNSEVVHRQMLEDAVATIRGGFPSGLPFLTVLGNHDIRKMGAGNKGARDYYCNYILPIMSTEIGNLTGVTPGTIDYPVYSFRLGDDLWVFCDFPSTDTGKICDAINADTSARHVFLVSHGPFTGNYLVGSGSAAEHLYEVLSRRHAIVISGHTHVTGYYWYRNEYGGFAEMTVNSVWKSEGLATSVQSSYLADYTGSYKSSLKRYFQNKAAGHYRLNVSDDAVTMEFYPGAAITPARVFTMWNKEAVKSSRWLNESALVTGTTGAWSEAVDYDWDTDKASIAGDRTFTPKRQSTGKSATVTVKMQFTDMVNTVDAPEGVQAAVQLGAGGLFQVWTTRNGVKSWLDVAAEGIVPRAGVEYTFRFKLDYGTRLYSVSVQNAGGGFTPLGANGETAFPLASNATRLSSVRFKGGGVLTSLNGDYTRGLGVVIR